MMNWGNSGKSCLSLSEHWDLLGWASAAVHPSLKLHTHPNQSLLPYKQTQVLLRQLLRGISRYLQSPSSSPGAECTSDPLATYYSSGGRFTAAWPAQPSPSPWAQKNASLLKEPSQPILGLGYLRALSNSFFDF